jgi:hypothetical protein
MGGFSDGLGLYSSEPPSKTNYRSIGRGTGGVAISAKKKSADSSWRDSDYQTIPSIPGKFETVLYRGNQEEKGFGARAPRFGQESRNSELPGPGAFGNVTAPERGILEAAGKRGHGPFASKTPRQKDSKTAVPGPGSYKATEGSSSSSQRTRSAPNAVFVQPSSVNPASFNKRVSPGPLDYPGATVYGPKSTASSTGACLSHAGERGDRTGSLALAACAPGPGAYEDRDRTIAGEAAQSRRDGGSHGPTSKKWLTPREEKANISEAALMRKSSEMLTEDTNSSKAGPGPGQYNPKPEALSGGGQTSFSTGESVSFRYGTSNLPRQWRKIGPAPGDYESRPPEPVSAAAAGAAFASNANRFDAKPPDAPGPAYYSPGRTAQ